MFSRILHLGIHPGLDFYQKRETKALNVFAVTTIVGLILGTTNIYFLGANYPLACTLFELVSGVAILYLNYRGFYQFASFSFVFSINIALAYLNNYFPAGSGTYFYYFPLVFCVALLYNPIKFRYRVILFFGIIALSYLSSQYFDFTFIHKVQLSEKQSYALFLFNLNICLVLTMVLVYLMINLINNQYNELSDLLENTKKNQVTIQNSLKEKEVLLAEIQHRVKNNLSVIIGLFNLQKAASGNEETQQAMIEARNRVLSIAMVHERLYRKDNFSSINLKLYLSELAKEVVRSHPLHTKMKITEEMDEITVDITRAIPIGLVVNESITNSLKHAFRSNNPAPQINIVLNSHFGVINVKVQDNGPGFPPPSEISDKSLGLGLIESLAQQIDGNVHYSSNGGATVKLSFPQ